MFFDNRIIKARRVKQQVSLDPVEFARTRLNFEPDEIQCGILRSTAKRGILDCLRQFGKTTVSAAKAIFRAFTEPKSLIVVASPGERLSGISLRAAGEMLRILGIRPEGDGYNKLSLVLPNGSRIVGLSGGEDKVRGFGGPSMPLIDEASRVSKRCISLPIPADWSFSQWENA